MSDPTDPHLGDDLQSGLADLPGDRTQRVRTRFPDPAEAPLVEAVEEEAADDEFVDPPQPVGPVPAYLPSSTELAGSSRRTLRRQRDRRAEQRALQVVVALFVGLGGLAFVLVNLLLDDPPPPNDLATAADPPIQAPGGANTDVAEAPPPRDVISTPFVDTVDLPALRQLRNEGLTIVAEGLPEVESLTPGPAVAPLAAVETCRFAYGVWEFSPNRRFAFLPTCPALEGQVLYGAYRIEGGNVRMSALRVLNVELNSVFQVEKPSQLITEVRVDGGRVRLAVRQRVTVIRAGQFGDTFFSTYAPKNTLGMPGRSAGRPPPDEPRVPVEAPGPPPSPPDRSQGTDPLLELLKGGR